MTDVTDKATVLVITYMVLEVEKGFLKKFRWILKR
jgi:hypothetical protein